MGTANPKIILSRSQDISFNKLVLSQATIRRVCVELTGFTGGMVERPKAMLISGIIAWRLRRFVPTGSQGPMVLAALLGRYKLTGISQRAVA